MNKRILAIGLTLALGGLSTAAFAGNAGDPGQFYVGAGVGQAKWHFDVSDVHLDDSDTAANVRFGYVWHWGVDFAVEGGYADLGEYKTSYTDATDRVLTTDKFDGLFGGVKVKYGFAQNWFVAGRAGLFQTHFKQNGSDTYRWQGTTQVDKYSSDETSTKWYAGVGVGYDVSRHFSLALNYTYYRTDAVDVDMNIQTAGVSAEYRF